MIVLLLGVVAIWRLAREEKEEEVNVKMTTATTTITTSSSSSTLTTFLVVVLLTWIASDPARAAFIGISALIFLRLLVESPPSCMHSLDQIFGADYRSLKLYRVVAMSLLAAKYLVEYRVELFGPSPHFRDVLLPKEYILEHLPYSPSLHTMTDDTITLAVLFVLQMVLILILASGRLAPAPGRVAAGLAWLLHRSLLNRNPWFGDAHRALEDRILMSLVWLYPDTIATSSGRVANAATATLLVQFVLIFVTSGFDKSFEPSWMRDGIAVVASMRSTWGTAFGRYLAEIARVVAPQSVHVVLCRVFVFLECPGCAALMLWPSKRVRAFAVAMYGTFLLSFRAGLRVGWFPIYTWTLLLPFVPASWFPGPPPSPRRRRRRDFSLLASVVPAATTLLLLYGAAMCAWRDRLGGPSDPPLLGTTNALVVASYWAAFSHVEKFALRFGYVAVVTTADGRRATIRLDTSFDESLVDDAALAFGPAWIDDDGGVPGEMRLRLGNTGVDRWWTLVPVWSEGHDPLKGLQIRHMCADYRRRRNSSSASPPHTIEVWMFWRTVGLPFASPAQAVAEDAVYARLTHLVGTCDDDDRIATPFPVAAIPTQHTFSRETIDTELRMPVREKASREIYEDWFRFRRAFVAAASEIGK